MTNTTNTVICGDAVGALKGIAPGSVDLVITDPPYLVNYNDRDGRSVANDSNADAVLPAFDGIYRALKPNSLCICFSGWTALDQFTAAWIEAGFRLIGHIVWTKDYASNSRQTAFHHESAYVLAKGYPKPPANPFPDVQEWTYSGNRFHPTAKAVEIIAPLVRAFSKPGDTVLDPFLGSGTTAVAAALSGRSAIGIELEERYCALAKRRLEGVTRFQAKPKLAPQLAA